MESGTQIENQRLKKCNCMYICLQNTFASCTHLLILCLTLKYNLIGKINTLLGFRKNTFLYNGQSNMFTKYFSYGNVCRNKNLKVFFSVQEEKSYMLSLQRSI